MRRMLPRSRRIEIAQAAERRGAGVAPEQTYALPGSRFVEVCRMIRGGATDEEIETVWPEFRKDAGTLEVYRKHVRGELSEGALKCPAIIYTARSIKGRKPMETPRKNEAYGLFDAGYSAKEVAQRMDLDVKSVYRYMKWWREDRRWQNSGD